MLNYIAILAPIAFVLVYCSFQSARDLRGHRYIVGVAGVVCALLAFAMFVVEAYNAAILLNVVSPTRIIAN
jgi:hypothetical protein